jgi:hypothetical protein
LTELVRAIAISALGGATVRIGRINAGTGRVRLEFVR